MIAEFDTPLVTAMHDGQWDGAYAEAHRWLERPDCGPLPFFV